MKYFLSILVLGLHSHGGAQPAVKLSRNVYRIPCGDCKAIEVMQDYYTHTPSHLFQEDVINRIKTFK